MLAYASHHVAQSFCREPQRSCFERFMAETPSTIRHPSGHMWGAAVRAAARHRFKFSLQCESGFKALLKAGGHPNGVSASLFTEIYQEIPQLAQVIKADAAKAGINFDLKIESQTLYYGKAPKYSYYDGHSQGGRQGLRLPGRWFFRIGTVTGALDAPNTLESPETQAQRRPIEWKKQRCTR